MLGFASPAGTRARRAALAAAVPAFLLLITSLSAATDASAQADQRSAEEWLEASQRARFPLESMVASFELTIDRADGSQLLRSGEAYRTNRPGSNAALADRLYVVATPKSLTGLALLSKDLEGQPADQWVYLPAYRRARRIAVHGAGDAFVGSDFLYVDLARVRTETGKHRVVGEAEVNNRAVVKIETRNEDPAVPYGRFVSFIDRETALPVRVEYFDREDAPMKIGRLERIEEVEGIPSPLVIVMENLETGGTSRLDLTSVTYAKTVSPEIFTIEHLEDLGPPR